MPVFSVHALSLILFSDLALATTSTCLIHLMNYFLFLNVEEASGVSTGLSCAGHIQVCFFTVHWFSGRPRRPKRAWAENPLHPSNLHCCSCRRALNTIITSANMSNSYASGLYICTLRESRVQFVLYHYSQVAFVTARRTVGDRKRSGAACANWISQRWTKILAPLKRTAALYHIWHHPPTDKLQTSKEPFPTPTRHIYNTICK